MTSHFPGLILLYTQIHDLSLSWFDTPNTQIHDHSLSWFDTPNTQIHDLSLSWFDTPNTQIQIIVNPTTIRSRLL